MSEKEKLENQNSPIVPTAADVIQNLNAGDEGGRRNLKAYIRENAKSFRDFLDRHARFDRGRAWEALLDAIETELGVRPARHTAASYLGACASDVAAKRKAEAVKNAPPASTASRKVGNRFLPRD